MIKFIKKIFSSQKNDVALINNPNEINTEIVSSNSETDSNELNVNDKSIDSNTSIPIIYNEDCLPQIIKPHHVNSVGINFKFFAWQVKEGEWVKAGTPLYGICNSIHYEYGAFNPICADKSGVIEYLKSPDDDIKNGDIVGYIHPTGFFENENLVTNNTYYYYFNINKFDFSNEYLYHYEGYLSIMHLLDFKTIKWEKIDNEFVKKGDLIFAFEYELLGYNDSEDKRAVKYHYAEKEGYIDINKNGSTTLDMLNQIIYKIHSDYNQLLISKFKNEPQIQIDDFNDSVKINWNVVGGYVNHYETANNVTIGGIILNTDDGRNFIFSFESYDNKDYIVFYYSFNDYKLAIGDKISFMFEDSLKHTFNIIEKSISSKIINAKLYETKVQITTDELQIFSEKNLLKWKIENTESNTSIISDAKNFYWYSNNLHQIVVKNLANEYLELIDKYVINHLPLNGRTQAESLSRNIVEECYVYLMIDTTNNFHKIGISNNPTYREKTLQSDKPTIELLHKKSFPNRKIAEILEKTLHQTYANKRIRGEWFELDSYEINEIIVLLD